jgi:hypothetical protein
LAKPEIAMRSPRHDPPRHIAARSPAADLVRTMHPMNPSRRLTLKEAPAPVKEAKDAARLAGVAGDHAATNWALRLIEARDDWRNRPRPGPGVRG